MRTPNAVLIGCLLALSVYSADAGSRLPFEAAMDIFALETPLLFDLAYREHPDRSINLADAHWRIRPGDDPAWAAPDFDNADWTTVNVGKPLAAQGYEGGRFFWYRTVFDVPGDWESDRDFLLDLGRISVFDQVFLNGVEVGHYSNLPPAPPEPGSSGVRRRYPVDPAAVRFGEKNVLAVRVQVGVGSGMYEGPYAFSALERDVSVNFALKPNPNEGPQSPPSSSDHLSHYLTHADHLNRFYRGDPVRVLPQIVGLSGKHHGAKHLLRVRVTDEEERLVFSGQRVLPVYHRRFTAPLISLDVPPEGRFVCELELAAADGSAVWSERLPFTRSARPETISLPVDERLGRETPNWHRPHRIHRDSVGRYGARRINEEGKLDPAVREEDRRGALTYVSRVDPNEPDILIYQTNVAEPPRASARTPAGHRYDGYADLWPLGYVSVEQQYPPTAIEVESDWTKRLYRLHYDNGTTLEFTNSTLSPAYRVRTTAERIEVFRDLDEWGLGPPAHFTFRSTEGVRTRLSDEGLRGKEMEANWLLVRFHGSENWTSFDMPWLFVLERRPDKVRVRDGALRFEFSGEAGHLFGMPLFGVRLPTQFETGRWTNGPPSAVVGACVFWSETLLRYPEFVERNFAVDFSENVLTVEDRIRFSDIEDAWGTEPATRSPLSPTLVLSAISNNLDIKFDRPVVDPALTTLHGPLVLADGSETVRFRLLNLIDYMRQARAVRDIPAGDPVYEREREKLEEAVWAVFKDEPLDEHPWTRSLRRRGVVAGYAADLASHLILAVPHLSEELRNRLTSTLRGELRGNFLFSGYPDERMKRHISEAFWHRSTITKTIDTINDLPLAMNARDAARGGLDGIVMETFRLHAIWQIAEAVDAWEDVEEHWALIRKIFNTVPHSHDWAINQSWDFFSGIRIGNGLQEAGVIYAGMLGLGRAARRLGHDDLEEYAAYLAAMQLVAMNAAATGIHYIRHHRPWSAAHSESASIEEVESKLRERYIEFNEFAGSSQNIINARDDVQNPYSYTLWGLPDTKRPYNDIWPEANQYFFEKPRVLGSVRQPLLNLVAYLQRAGPEEVQQRYRETQEPAYRASPYVGYTNAHPDLVNIRVFLETLAQVSWAPER